MAAPDNVFLNISNFDGVEHAYEVEMLHGQPFQSVKRAMRLLSKALTNGKVRDMFRARLVRSITGYVLANGGLTTSVGELLDWQDEEERAGDADEEVKIKVVVCNNADRDERTAKKQKVCAYHVRGNCHFGQKCKNPHD